MLLCVSVSCISVKNYNKKLETPISPKHLKADVDFTAHQLEKLHPKLYWYISKEKLHYKFDSLKSTLNKPLTPQQFYFKFQPVITNIREGHLRLNMPMKRLTKKEVKNLKYQKGLFSPYNYVVHDRHLYISENKDQNPDVKIGMEILSIGNQSVVDLLGKYRHLSNSDGFNTTFIKYWLAKNWANYYTAEYGLLDSVKLVTRENNLAKNFFIKRKRITPEQKKLDDQAIKVKEKENKNQDYDDLKNAYNRQLSFLKMDSSVAYMKIRSFSGTRSKQFYKEAFAQLNRAKTPYLILDIRDNFGGSLKEINNLYSYLAEKKGRFIKDIEVTSSHSIYEADYFVGAPKMFYPFLAVGYPFYMLQLALANKTEDGKHIIKTKYGVKHLKANHYTGKVYVLINGGSFSAASILPAKLKGDKRAYLVGEETGGANDGTVAGRSSTKTLPYSKIKIPIGLMLIQPAIKLSGLKRGVFPDKEILPTLAEILAKKDVQKDWILAQIESELSKK